LNNNKPVLGFLVWFFNTSFTVLFVLIMKIDTKTDCFMMFLFAESISLESFTLPNVWKASASFYRWVCGRSLYSNNKKLYCILLNTSIASLFNVRFFSGFVLCCWVDMHTHTHTDITLGDNRCTEGYCCPFGFGATKGWDAVVLFHFEPYPHPHPHPIYTLSPRSSFVGFNSRLIFRTISHKPQSYSIF
jgi:hypothetical protein